MLREPSHWDGSFEHPQLMMGKIILNTHLGSGCYLQRGPSHRDGSLGQPQSMLLRSMKDIF